MGFLRGLVLHGAVGSSRRDALDAIMSVVKGDPTPRRRWERGKEVKPCSHVYLRLGGLLST